MRIANSVVRNMASIKRLPVSVARWQGLAKAVAQIEFLEWTGADRPGHSKFAGLREDKDPRTVVKEAGGA